MKEQKTLIVRAINSTKNTVLAEHAAVADSFFHRGWALLGCYDLPRDEGMLITGTNGIHSFFMRFRFDAVYLDSQGSVCHIVADFSQFPLGHLVWRARHVLDLTAGTIARTGTVVGDVVVFRADPSLDSTARRIRHDHKSWLAMLSRRTTYMMIRGAH